MTLRRALAWPLLLLLLATATTVLNVETETLKRVFTGYLGAVLWFQLTVFVLSTEGFARGAGGLAAALSTAPHRTAARLLPSAVACLSLPVLVAGHLFRANYLVGVAYKLLFALHLAHRGSLGPA